MKRLITTLSIMSSLLISCQQSLTPDYPESTALADEVITKSLSTGKVSPDDPIVFLPAIDVQAWTDILLLEDRFAASEVPAARLAKMTTEALVKSMMNYPLNYLIFVFNEPKSAIDLIVKNSSLHQEFLNRQDALDVFVEMYSRAQLDMSPDKSDFDGNYDSLSYTNAMFLDCFLGTKMIANIERSSEKQRLGDVVKQKLEMRLTDIETFSLFSINPLLTIDHNAALGVVSDVQFRSSSYSVTTTYTPLGHLIEVLHIDEMTADEMEQITNDCIFHYPNALVRGSSTCDYNCHSYAWIDSTVENTYWLNATSQSQEFQLSKFWVSDAYENCYEAEGKVVYYSQGDHSGVVLPNGKYLSKWGAGPLMEHDPTYCPYPPTNRQYFRIRQSPLMSELTISGRTTVSINQRNTYSVSRYCPLLSYTWNIQSFNVNSTTPYQLEVGGSYCILTCLDYGLYNTRAYGYYKGHHVATAQLDVYALP